MLIFLLILTHRWRDSITELTLCRVPYFVYYSSLVDNLWSGSMVKFVRNPHERLGRKCFGISLLETSIYFVQFFSDTKAQWTIWSWKISLTIWIFTDEYLNFFTFIKYLLCWTGNICPLEIFHLPKYLFHDPKFFVLFLLTLIPRNCKQKTLPKSELILFLFPLSFEQKWSRKIVPEN